MNPTHIVDVSTFSMEKKYKTNLKILKKWGVIRKCQSNMDRQFNDPQKKVKKT